jgi:hypothetical protein
MVDRDISISFSFPLLFFLLFVSPLFFISLEINKTRRERGRKKKKKKKEGDTKKGK